MAQRGGVLYVPMTMARIPIIRAARVPNRFCKWVATWEMAQQAPTAMVALTAGSVASSNFTSKVWWRQRL